MSFDMSSITTEPGLSGHTGALFEGLAVPADSAAVLKRSAPKGAPRVQSAVRNQVELRACDLDSSLPADHQARAVCEQFGLGSFVEKVAGSLTAGQRRNLELARVQVGAPELLMLDEPSSGLSQDEVESLKASLCKLNEAGLTILLVTHDMDLMAIAQCVHVLSAGEIIASGTMQDMQRNPQVQQVYLGID